MSARPHSLSRHRGRRKGKRGQNNDRMPAQAGAHNSFKIGASPSANQGTPRFLTKPKVSEADVSSSSEKEAREGHGHDVSEQPVETPLGKAAAQAMGSTGDRGRPLGESERAETESRLGEDFSGVSVTENSALASGFGANAMTYDDAIHIAPGRKVTSDLLSHELTHVAQQRQFGSSAAQFDISMNATDEDTGLGLMDISMSTLAQPSGAATKSGMYTEIDFLPHVTAPYSNRIGLMQTADDERLDMPGEPEYEWTGGEANREDIKTDEGSFIDMLHANLPEDRNTEPWYWQGFPTVDPENSASSQRFGWNRSSGDQHSTHLTDYPGSTGARRFTLETVAIGRDNQTIYGSVNWGFETDGSGGTSNEWFEIPKIDQSGSEQCYESDNFQEALGNFRNFYAHEPIIVYFGSAEGVVQPSELAKLTDAPSYLAENPEAQIRLTATADMQGGVSDTNHRLAMERMDSVYAELVRLGVAESDIVRDEAGANASRAQGSSDPALRNTEGSFQANRRVTVTFENTQSLPP